MTGVQTCALPIWASRLVDLIVSLAGDGGADAKPFIAALVENKRVEALPAMRAHYEALKNERQGAVDAKIETALELTPEQLGALVADLEKKFGRRIRPQVSVDKELIGGARVTVGDQVIDGSVRETNGALRVTIHMIDARKGSYVWSESMDYSSGDDLSHQKDIAARILRKLGKESSAHAEPVLSSSNREAHNLYLRGRFHCSQRSEKGLARAVRCFEKMCHVRDFCVFDW